MPNKKLSFGSKPRPANADEWVEGNASSGREMPPAPGPATAPPKGELKRLTLDLDKGLHRRIKSACAVRGTTMVEEITKLLEREFPR
jgi:hypothetical protein